jgi:hypothetical protein
MAAHWSADQALKQDVRTFRSGKRLAVPAGWTTLGCNQHIIWGESQHNPRTPRRVCVGLAGPTFHCTCTSRKNPCKHALGLFLLLVEQPNVFAQTPPPDWVPVEDSAPDSTQRLLADGMHTLARWLRDLVRGGLTAVQGQSSSTWDEIITRMADSHAPGLAQWLRRMACISSVGAEGWPGQLLEHIGRLYLLIEGFEHYESLTPEVQADIRAVIGSSGETEPPATGLSEQDCWLVLGHRAQPEFSNGDLPDWLEENIPHRHRIWLWGTHTRRIALITQSNRAPTLPEADLAPGNRLQARLTFYVSNYPLHATFSGPRSEAPAWAEVEMPCYATIEAAMDAYAEALAHNPWLEHFPMLLQAVIPVRQAVGKTALWAALDPTGTVQALPFAPRFDAGWQLLALSGGNPLSLFGEWDGNALLPLSAWVEDRFVVLKT